MQNFSEKYLEILKSLENDEELFSKFEQLKQFEDIDISNQKENLFKILDIEFKPAHLSFIALTRIQNELQQFTSKGLHHIKIMKIQGQNSLYNHQLIIVMYGKVDTPYEGGIYTFLLTFPDNFPFQPPYFRTLLPLKHPHIYPNMRLCTPTIIESYTIQSYSLYELLETWYCILHRKPNTQSLANTKVYEQYDEQFIKCQARFLNKNNPILRLFQINNENDNEDENNGINIIQL